MLNDFQRWMARADEARADGKLAPLLGESCPTCWRQLFPADLTNVPEGVAFCECGAETRSARAMIADALRAHGFYDEAAAADEGVVFVPDRRTGQVPD